MPAPSPATIAAPLPALATPPGRQPRVICVTSGKGGVGKTNVVANLAFVFARQGKRVLVLDADLSLANVDVLLGLAPRHNIQHVLAGDKTLAEIVTTGPGGMRILPAASGILELSDLSDSQKLYLLAEVEALAEDVDILLIDTAAGINANVVYFILAAAERIVLVTPEPTSLTDAYALIKVLSSRHQVRRFQILVNHARSEQEAVGVFRKLGAVADRFLTTLSLDFLGFIPYDEHIPRAVRQQRLVAQLYPKAAASQSLRRLSEQILGNGPEPEADGNIKFFWKNLMHREP
ncbi:MAG: MinD/ParA family protein [Thermodesulfobacteriota bacterium]